MRNNWFILLVAVLVLVSILIFWRGCDSIIGNSGPKVEYVKGKTKTVYLEGKKDTMYLPSITKWKIKKVVELKTDTVYIDSQLVARSIANDTLKVRGVTIVLRDTIMNGRMYRHANIIRNDSAMVVTKTDTVKTLQVDTVYITKTGIVVKVAFVGGYALGVATGIAATMIAKPP